MGGVFAAFFLLVLLWLQLAMGPNSLFGLDWSLCGLLVLGFKMRSPSYQIDAIGLGLARDVFSTAPLGAQALALGVTSVVVHYFGGLVFLENYLIQGALFFLGYLFYQSFFFCLGKCFGFIQGEFWCYFILKIPSAVAAVLFCWILSLVLSRWPHRSSNR